MTSHHLGAGMGLVGTLENAGKVVGPVLGGILIVWLGYTGMFWLMGVLLLSGAVAIVAWTGATSNRGAVTESQR